MDDSGWRNRNVLLYIILNFLDMAGWGVWGYSFLSNIIYISTESTLRIGLAEGVQGILSGILAIPFGILADRWIRHKVAKIGLSIKLVACVCMLCCFNITSIPKDMFYWFLMGSLGLYGISVGISTPALSTLFTNSIRTGDRTEWLSKLLIIKCLELT